MATQNLRRLESHVQGLQTRAKAMDMTLVTAQDQHLLSELIIAMEENQELGAG